MPLCTAFLDDMRAHFGDPVWIKATENGHEIEWGRPSLETTGRNSA